MGHKTDDAFSLLFFFFFTTAVPPYDPAALSTDTSFLVPYFRRLLSSSAKALLDDGQPHAADRLLRQALQQGYDPLGTSTYASVCFTQHVNMLKGWGVEVGWCL